MPQDNDTSKIWSKIRKIDNSILSINNKLDELDNRIYKLVQDLPDKWEK